jgi:hypothetical protein
MKATVEQSRQVAVIMGLSRNGFAFLQIVFGSIERTSSQKQILDGS